MTLLAGLVSIPNDTPHARGALAFCRAQAERREAETRPAAIPDRMIADHVALVVSEAYQSRPPHRLI